MYNLSKSIIFFVKNIKLAICIMASEPVSQTFYVQAMNIAVDADKALISGVETTEFDSDVVAEVDVELTVVQNLFKFQSDAIDIDNLDSEDLKFKVDYVADTTLDDNNVPVTVLTPDFLTNTLCISSGKVGGVSTNDSVFENNTVGAAKKAVADDFTRYLAFKLFRTAMGVDLFDNETEVKNSINDKAREALHTTLTALTEANTGAYLTKDESTGEPFITDFEHPHPSYQIISQMILNVPDRFQTLDEYAVPNADNSGADPSEPAPTFRAPLLAGDSIVFRLLIKAESTQASIVEGDGTIEFEGAVVGSGGRVYAIKLNVVDDAI